MKQTEALKINQWTDFHLFKSWQWFSFDPAKSRSEISQIFRRYKDSSIIEDRLDKSFNENRGTLAEHGTDGDGGQQVHFQSLQNVREFRSDW